MQQPQKSQKPILVTGANGYLGSYIVQMLVQQGYDVIGSVKNMQNQSSFEHLWYIHPEIKQKLKIVQADILEPTQWDSIMSQVDYVIHTATPMPHKNRNLNQEQYISQAVKGTQNIFMCAVKNNVKKVVFSGSNGSIHQGFKLKNHFCDHDWANPKEISGLHEKAKYFQEKEIWRLYEKNKDKIEISILLLGLMMGPSLSSNFSISNGLLINAMNNQLGIIPLMGIPLVDVRDAARAHILCIGEKRELSNAKRYVVVEGSYWFQDILDVLRDEFEKQGYNITKKHLWTQLFQKILLQKIPNFDLFIGYMGRLQLCDNTSSKKELGINYKYFRETILDSAFDYLARGVVKIRQANAKL